MFVGNSGTSTGSRMGAPAGKTKMSLEFGMVFIYPRRKVRRHERTRTEGHERGRASFQLFFKDKTSCVRPLPSHFPNSRATLVCDYYFLRFSFMNQGSILVRS